MRLAAYFIMTLLFSTAVAQNPTILQGSYVSNVFGQSNFVKNPNAQTGVTGVTLTTATATRSKTTPLVATTEWNVTITSANGTVAWATRTFDAGMKNQNCEARFTYRGFQATSKAQIKHGTNVVAELVLTPSATDPRIASINFPCGDLSQPTTFVITDTAILSGTHEIGGIYVGLATNMANIAQAETVVRARQTAAQTVPNVTRTTILYQTEDLDVYGEYDPSTGIYTAKKSGEYLITASVMSGNVAWSIGEYFEIAVMKNSASNSYCRNYKEMEGNNTANEGLLISCIINLQAGENTRISWTHQQGGNISTIGDGSYVFLQIARFPSSSELVVTPETQNVFGGIRTLAASGFFSTASTTNTQITGLGNFTAVGSATSAGSMQFTMPTVPVGTYKLEFFVLSEAVPAAANQRTDCVYTIYDGSDIYTAAYLSSLREGSPTDTPVQGGVFGSAVVRYNSVQTNKQFTVQVRRAGTGGTCASYGAGLYSAYFTITPLDNNANSALYVQGPVKAAGTGTAIPAGYVGEEVINSTPITTATTTTANVEIPVPNATITLGPGVWDLEYNIQMGAYRTPASTNSVYCRTRLQENGTPMADTEKFHGTYNLSNVITNTYAQLLLKKRVYITTGTKTYQLTVVANQNNTVGFCAAESGHMTGSFAGDDTHSYVRAVRIN